MERGLVATMRKVSLLGLVLLVGVLFLGCPKTLDDSRSPYLLYISSIVPSELMSDVCTTSDPLLGCVEIVDDSIAVTLSADSKVQVVTTTGLGTGALQAIVLQRYRITYSRIAGPLLNPPAPAPVEGALTETVEVPGITTVDLVAVPFSYKNEEPLLSLRQSPYDVKAYELRCLATLEVWATDLSGNPIHVSAGFTARFSDATSQSQG
jgi:hypothetical protein